MLTNKWFLLILSASAYVLPFIFSEYLWWIVFLFPIPLFYAALTHTLSFKEGYIWGIVSLSLHLSGVLISIIKMAEGSYSYRFIPVVVMILYESIYSGLWFWCTTASIRIANLGKSTVATLSVWVFTFWLYNYWLEHYSLWIFDIKEGYFLMQPLLPLAHNPRFLSFLPILGKSLLTFLLFLPSASIAFFLTRRKLLPFLAIIISCLPWVIDWHTALQTKSPPSWLHKITCLQKIYPQIPNLSTMALAVAHDIKAKIKNRPDVELVILPESAFYSTHLFSSPELASLWNQHHLLRPLHIVVGSFRLDNNNHYCNSLYWIHNGILKICFDKKHTMFFTERIPSLFDFSFIRSLFFKKRPPITSSKNPRPYLHILKETAFVPYICSELFFNEYPENSYVKTPILSINNDNWIWMPYVKKLMYLTAKFKALQWKRDIIYISYSRAVFLGSDGNEWPIV